MVEEMRLSTYVIEFIMQKSTIAPHGKAGFKKNNNKYLFEKF